MVRRLADLQPGVDSAHLDVAASIFSVRQVSEVTAVASDAFHGRVDLIKGQVPFRRCWRGAPLGLHVGGQGASADAKNADIEFALLPGIDRFEQLADRAATVEVGYRLL